MAERSSALPGTLHFLLAVCQTLATFRWFATLGEPLDVKVVQITLNKLLFAAAFAELSTSTLAIFHALLEIAKIVPFYMLNVIGV